MIIYYDTICTHPIDHRGITCFSYVSIEVRKPLVIQGFAICLDLRLDTVLKGACLSTSLLSLL